MRSIAFSLVLPALVLGLGACGDPEIIVPASLEVSVYPPHGATAIDPAVEILVYFTHEVADAPGAAAAISLRCEGAPPCSAPDATACPESAAWSTSFAPDGKVAHLLPELSLVVNSCYAVRIAQGIAAADQDVAPLSADHHSGFQTKP